MRPELHAYLDGEIRLEDLPHELRAEAERWDRLLQDVRAAGPTGAPAGLEERIGRALAPRYRGRTGWRRAVDWAVSPRPIRVSPLAALAAAAVLMLLVVQPWESRTPAPVEVESPATVYVQFMIQAPGASSVAVAGDFSGWAPTAQLQDVDGDGVWTGRVPITSGVHEYMFVIDGTEWVTDPNADRYSDDGFGNRNAVMVVAPPNSRS